MKVKNRITGGTMESDNPFIVEQWLAAPERYEPVKEKDFLADEKPKAKKAAKTVTEMPEK